MALIKASDFNSPAAYYNNTLGLGIRKVKVGEHVNGAIWIHMLKLATHVTATQGRTWTNNLPPLKYYTVGSTIFRHFCPQVSPKTPPVSLEITDDLIFTIPAGVTTLTVDRASSGGGGGGGGMYTFDINGQAGSGGAAGTYLENQTFDVMTGDVIAIRIGKGGTGGYASAGKQGGPTTLTKNTVLLIDLPGGNGGGYGINNVGGAGYEFGTDGGVAQRNIGGNGGRNPFGNGGQGGKDSMPGCDGLLYGTSGGGGGFKYKSLDLFYKGGDGFDGICKITYQ